MGHSARPYSARPGRRQSPCLPNRRRSTNKSCKPPASSLNSEPDWVTFFREILGVDGIVRRQFTRLEDLTAFEKSPEFEQIQKWLVKLREQKNATDTESEPTRVITVRLPKSMHEYLRTEAHDLRTSMNKLCISKLLQVIEQDLIPTERSSCPAQPDQQAGPAASDRQHQ